MQIRLGYKVFSAGLAMLAAFALATCGGGGGGGSSIGGSVVTSGVITGKGSIIVNGVEFETPTDPGKIIIDDTPGHFESELKIGMFVKIKGFSDGPSRGRATEIEAEAEVKGVATINGDSLTVLKQTVNVNGFTRFEDTSATAADLSPLDGAFVEIHGLFTAPNTILAMLIEQEGPGEDEAELRGEVTSVTRSGDTGTLFIGMQEVSFDRFGTRFEDVTFESVQAGDFIEVEGRVAGNTLVSEKIEKEDFRDDLEDADEFENTVRIEANLDAVDPDNKTVAILGLSVSVVGARLDDVASLDALAAIPNAHVEIRGNPDGLGGVNASRLKLEDPDGRTILQGPVESHDPGGPDLKILGITVRTDVNTEFENAADNPIDGPTFFGSITDGVTIVKARGSFDASTSILTAEEVEFEFD